MVSYIIFLFLSPALLHSTSISLQNDERDADIECEKCRIKMPRNEYRYHLKTNLHKSKSLIKTEFDNIDIVATAFKNRIVTYRLNPSQKVEYLSPEAFLRGSRLNPSQKDEYLTTEAFLRGDRIKPSQKVEYLTPEAFLRDNQNNIIKLINISLKKHGCIKLNFELFAYFILPKSNEQQLKSFNTKYETAYQSTELDELFKNLIEKFKTKLAEFEHCESGWSFQCISHLEININKYSPMRGGTFIDLPKSIKVTKSCINVQNMDNYCFLWSIVAGLFPAKSNVCRVNSYPHYSTIFNINEMNFPPTFTDIRLFESNNPDISINIYGLDNKCHITGPLYLTKNRKIDHFNLLYIERNNNGHYCLIKDLARLVKHQVTSHKDKCFLCESCLQFFTSKSKFRLHKCNKMLTILPKKGSILKFTHYERQQKINFVIYADFECLLTNYKEQKSKYIETLKKHQPTSFGYYICCSHDRNLNKYVSYRGIDCVEVFIKSLIKDAEIINDILSD